MTTLRNPNYFYYSMVKVFEIDKTPSEAFQNTVLISKLKNRNMFKSAYHNSVHFLPPLSPLQGS